jgi:hypothetical protein
MHQSVMKTLRHIAALSLSVSLCGSALAETVTGEIKQIDPAANTFTVVGTKGEFHPFKTKVTTEVQVDGKRANVKDLSLGMQAQVTVGEPGTAARIISPPPGTQLKAASGQMAIKVPANALKANPIIVGSVIAGQKVTITPKKVWWTGGGSQRGQYCDWRGYKPEGSKGIPWMALVAAVGGTEHWAKDNTLTFTVPANGSLVLYANDDKGGNDGEAEVIVTVAK